MTLTTQVVELCSFQSMVMTSLHQVLTKEGILKKVITSEETIKSTKVYRINFLVARISQRTRSGIQRLNLSILSSTIQTNH
jgi:hypothetical protein